MATEREQIIELQKKMAEKQVELARKLAEFIGGDETEEFVDGLKALLADAIPGSQIDQSIGQLINVTAQTGQIAAQLFQAMMQQQAQQA